jgi:flavorubredoxin
MGITNASSKTRVDEVAEGIYRISTPVDVIPGGFSFNQYLIADREPLLFHTGPKRMAPLVAEAIASVLPLNTLKYIGFSHYESDECGSLNGLLAAAPAALPLCGRINAMVNGDTFDRPARVLQDGEAIALGRHTLRWFDTPHLPHGWECGYLMEETTRTLLCGDLFTQGGAEHPPLTTADILGPSEGLRAAMDYYARSPSTRALLAKLAQAKPTTLACMHGSAWQGDGAQLLTALADALGS